ncbi:MAG: homocysteine S-methyltransferase family protein [Butyrivibrio sp.]|nr:homocysteine S-methyltransferase family protein [Butyrivibrio sp.]
MNFTDCINGRESILMEGALGERLKREYHLTFDDNVVMASLVYSEEGRRALDQLWSEYAEIALAYHLPFLATTPTRRVNRESIEKTQFDDSIIRDNVRFLRSVQENQKAEMFVGGLLGCHGDAYTGQNALQLKEAEQFHDWEVKLFAEAGVDFLYAALIPDVEEAAGIALAVQKYKVPYIISFTIQSDGCLIDGTRISDAIEYIDKMTDDMPVCYMTNCVHPVIVRPALMQPFNCNDTVYRRFWGIQANTSPLSYAELDHAEDLKTSDPVILAEEMIKLRENNHIKIFGGCCGTDGRHMKEIARRM